MTQSRIKSYIAEHFRRMDGNVPYRAQVIADLHGTSEAVVEDMLVEMGLATEKEVSGACKSRTMERGIYRFPCDDDAILALHRAGWSVPEIAAECRSDEPHVLRTIGCYDADTAEQSEEPANTDCVPAHRGKINHDMAMKLYSRKCTDGEIAETIGVVTSAVAAWRYRNNLPANHSTRRRRLDCEAAAELYAEGMTDSQIGRKLGVSRSTVQKWRRQMNLKKNTRAGRRIMPNTHAQHA